MANHHRRADKELVQQILIDDPEFLRRIVERALQQLLEAEITEHVGAAPYERTPKTAKATAMATSRGSSKPGSAPSSFLYPRTGREPSQPTSLPATKGTRRPFS
jgi:hypothetical protein